VTEAPNEGAPPRFRIPWPITVGVGALALTIAVLLLLGRDKGPTAKIRDRRSNEPVAIMNDVTGSVKAVRGDDRRDLARGETVYLDERIETGKGASLSMKTYPMEAVVSLGEETDLSFESPAEVRLRSGRVRAEVGSAATVFITPHGQVMAMGTDLSVEVRAKGTAIDVRKGSAQVNGKQNLNAGGQMFLSALPAAPPSR
jgi:FecR protein